MDSTNNDASLSILIAEDDYVTAEILQYLLTEAGHTVCAVITQGCEVLEAVQRLKPDMVLMDVHLEDDTDGITATRELLAVVHVPVVVVSGTDSPDELAAIAKSGALGFIKKPISTEELQVNIRIVAQHNEVIRKLEHSELMHRSIFDDAAVGIYVCHKDGHYMASNEAYARMLGYNGPAELLRSIRSVGDQIYAQEDFHASLLEKLSTGEILSDVESQVYGKDGDILWVAEHLAPHLDDKGELTSYEGVVIDISAKKQAENDKNIAYSLMQITMDSIPDYVAVVDLDGFLIFVNKAFDRDLGKATEAERRVSFNTEENCPFCRFRNVVSSKQKLDAGFQVRGHCTIEGYAGTLSTGITPFLSSNGEVLGAVLMMRAVSEE